MTQAFRSSQILVVDTDEISRSGVPLETLTAAIIARMEPIWLLDLNSDDVRLLHSRLPSPPTRYLDRFHIYLPALDSDRRQTLLTKFFDVIGTDYDALIDTERNRANIRNLLRLLDEACGSLRGSTIIDYGCGSGLVLQVPEAEGVNIIGIDSSHVMRELAVSRGMRAHSNGFLAQLPRGSVRAAFSSYVLHLLPDLGGVRLLWSRLQQGGALAANFHKDVGFEALRGALESSGATTRSGSLPYTVRGHGRYAVFIKG